MTRKEILETSIAFGPFKTEHHNQAVDQRFRECFFTYLTEQVLPKVEGSFTTAEGKLTSHYDDIKFFGPNSILKNRYFYKITFRSPEGEERALGEVDYDRQHGTFIPGRIKPPHVRTLSHQRRIQDMMDKCLSIVQRYRAGEREIACPYCGLPLSIWYLEDRDLIKNIACPTKGCFNVHFD